MSGPAPEPAASLGTAPAKLILFGEHSVVYGHPALGMALTRGVKVTLRRGDGQVTARLGEGVDGAPLDPKHPGPTALVHAALGDAAKRYDTEIEIGVPPMAGLGTSAAIAIATLRARQTLEDSKPTPEVQLASAIEVENIAHGKSSGLDPAICIDGGVIRFQRIGGQPQVSAVRPAASFHLVVGVAGSHGGTGRRVAGVAALKATAPKAMEAALETLGQSAAIGTDALAQGELERAGAMLDLAHGVLGGIGLVGDRVESLVRIARATGALGAKMSGAGGSGGALFALVPDIVAGNSIAERWQAEGAEAWIETAS